MVTVALASTRRVPATPKVWLPPIWPPLASGSKPVCNQGDIFVISSTGGWLKWWVELLGVQKSKSHNWNLMGFTWVSFPCCKKKGLVKDVMYQKRWVEVVLLQMFACLPLTRTINCSARWCSWKHDPSLEDFFFPGTAEEWIGWLLTWNVDDSVVLEKLVQVHSLQVLIQQKHTKVMMSLGLESIEFRGRTS